MKLIKFIIPLLALLSSPLTLNAQEDYSIRSGDTLTVEVLEDSSLNRSIVVLPNGQVNFPFVGSLRAKGRTVSQVETSIRSGISSNFATPPTVFVSVVPRAALERSSATRVEKTIDVYFLGEVNKPGLAAVKPGTTLLQAMAVSGGFSRFAATKRVQLRRTDPRSGAQTVNQINYKALANGATLSNDIELKDGDVILVPERRLFE